MLVHPGPALHGWVPVQVSQGDFPVSPGHGLEPAGQLGVGAKERIGLGFIKPLAKTDQVIRLIVPDHGRGGFRPPTRVFHGPTKAHGKSSVDLTVDHP